MAIPISSPSRSATATRFSAIALVGQRGSPKPLPNGQEAWVVEHCVRHESPIRLLPAPHIHARHLRDVLDPSRANSQQRAHRRIVGRQPRHLPHRYKSQAEQRRSASPHRAVSTSPTKIVRPPPPGGSLNLLSGATPPGKRGLSRSSCSSRS